MLSDIPLLPTVGGRGHTMESDFRLHWLNNKELQFSMEAETILQELHRKSILEEGPEGGDQTGEEVESPMDDTHCDDLMNFGDGTDGKSEQDEHTESEPGRAKTVDDEFNIFFCVPVSKIRQELKPLM